MSSIKNYIFWGLFCGLLVCVAFLFGRLSILWPKKQAEIIGSNAAKAQENNENIDLNYYEELNQVVNEVPRAKNAPEENANKPNVPQSQEKMAEALAKVLGNETPKAVAESIHPPLLESTGSKYAIQVLSMNDRDSAISYMQKLKAKGYPAKVVEGKLADGRTVFRVRLHGFKSFADAEKYRIKFERDESSKAITVAQ